MTILAPPASALAALAAGDAFDTVDFRHALGCFGTGVTVVTAATEDGRRAGLTVNSFASVSLEPPLVLWSLKAASTSLAIFEAASHFAVNVLTAGQEDLARHFAQRASDKFAGIMVEQGRGDAPLLPQTLAQFECRNVFRYFGGDHVIFIGLVEAYRHGPGTPLLFNQGKFGTFVAGA